jgi:agmatinase
MISKQQKIAAFNDSWVGVNNGNIFGLPFDQDESDIVLIPVTWDVTTSYSPGTANGPQAILHASPQLDLFDPDLKDAWKNGIYMQPVSPKWLDLNQCLRAKAEKCIHALENGRGTDDKKLFAYYKEINQACEDIKSAVYNDAQNLLLQNKLIGVVGGDHSTPLGLMEALAEKYDNFAILQIDAHADLRVAFEGFTYSHASIMYNAMRISNVSKLIQVGIRDICQAEIDMINQSNGRIKTFYDWKIKEDAYLGTSWAKICEQIINELPDHVYISFDIDGLDPKLCPNTGTPVAGGLELQEAYYLLKKLSDSGKRIIGFDLCEVTPGSEEWDGNVGARILYKLCNLMWKSHHLNRK